MVMSISVRIFFFFIAALVLCYGVVDNEASHQIYPQFQNHETGISTISQSYRTAYHFQPSKNWMNDPNGPMIYKGIYHLFYQYNPKGSSWGNIVWGHSTSQDLVNWKQHEPAIYPSQPGDIYGAWSGSATILPDGQPAILYTGIDPRNQQVQNLATPENSSDPYLIRWLKSPKNPLMVPSKVIDIINASAFRDPSTAWRGSDGTWRVIIGSQLHDKGLAILYRSRDFIKWVKSYEPLHSAEGTGMWECPDFYPVSIDGNTGLDLPSFGPKVKYTLKVSLDNTKHDCYTLGEYDQVNNIYTPEIGSIEGDAGLRYDYGKFYASKSFYDSLHNRRILWGWLNESDNADKGWAGIQGFPRVVLLDKSRKQLVQWPVAEIEKLRYDAVNVPAQVLAGGGAKVKVPRITAAQADVEISFEVNNIEKAEILSQLMNPQMLCSQKGATVGGSLGPFGLHVFASKAMEEYTSVFFRIYKFQHKYVVLMCSDQSWSSLNPGNDMTTYGTFLDVDPMHEEISLRSLIDHSVVESFGGNGKSCITARVYPKLAINEDANLLAFNNGNESVNIKRFSAWSMKKAEIV